MPKYIGILLSTDGIAHISNICVVQANTKDEAVIKCKNLLRIQGISDYDLIVKLIDDLDGGWTFFQVPPAIRPPLIQWR